LNTSFVNWLMTNWLALVAFVVATILAAWQIYLHCRRKKEDIHVKLMMRESIDSPRLWIEVYLLNKGEITVGIKNVNLTWTGYFDNREIKKTVLFEPPKGSTIPLRLKSKDECFFTLFYYPQMEETVQCLSDEIWISVESTLGEVKRIDGGLVLQYIESLLVRREHEELGSS